MPTNPAGGARSPRPKGGGRHRAPESKGERAAAAVKHVAENAPRKSKVGRTARGAATGAATGAALGSVVPGVGTAVGGVVGGALGGAGGLAGAVREDAAARRANGARQVLVAEFLLCMVVVALSPLTDKHKSEPAGAWMKRAIAIMGVFFLLGLISAGGPGAARAATGFGGLLALVLMVSERSIFTMVAAKFGGRDTGEVAGTYFGDAATEAADAASAAANRAAAVSSSAALAQRSIQREA